MASQPTIWRRNRPEILAKQAKIRADNEAYRQQFIDAAAEDEAAKVAVVPPQRAEQKQQQAQRQQHPQQKRG